MVHSLSQEPSCEVNKPKHKDVHLGAGSVLHHISQRAPSVLVSHSLGLKDLDCSSPPAETLKNLHCKSIY